MRRALAGAAILCAVLAVFGIPACGKKSTQPKTTSGSTVPISNGTWEITFQITSSTGDCSMYEFFEKETLFVDDGLDDFFGDDCDYVITGSHFTHGCSDTLYQDTTCVAVFSFDGGGTFTATSFSSTFTLTIANTPPGCSAFYPDCVLHVTITGHRIGAAPQFSLRPTGPGRSRIVRFLRRR